MPHPPDLAARTRQNSVVSKPYQSITVSARREESSRSASFIAQPIIDETATIVAEFGKISVNEAEPSLSATPLPNIDEDAEKAEGFIRSFTTFVSVELKKNYLGWIKDRAKRAKTDDSTVIIRTNVREPITGTSVEKEMEVSQFAASKIELLNFFEISNPLRRAKLKDDFLDYYKILLRDEARTHPEIPHIRKALELENLDEKIDSFSTVHVESIAEIVQKAILKTFKPKFPREPKNSPPVVHFISLSKNNHLFVQLAASVEYLSLHESYSDSIDRLEELSRVTALGIQLEKERGPDTLVAFDEDEYEILINRRSFCELLVRLVECQRENRGCDVKRIKELALLQRVGAPKLKANTDRALEILAVNDHRFADWDIGQISVEMMELINPEKYERIGK